jgi:hypothetical protein
VKQESERKVGKIEEKVQDLYDRIAKMEKENIELKELYARLMASHMSSERN